MSPGEGNPFSRRRELWCNPKVVRRQVQALIDGRPSFVLVGDERSGKTEILAQIARTLETSGPPTFMSTIDAIAWTSETSQGELTSEGFWRSALTPLAETEDPTLARLFHQAAVRRFSSVALEPLSRALSRSGFRMLVQVDNIDALLLSPFSDLRALLSTIRKIAGLADQGITLMLTSPRRVEELNRHTEGLCAGSPFFNVFEEIVLDPLPDESVTKILDLADGRFTITDRTFIKRAVGGHPELLWRAAQVMWETHVQNVSQQDRVLRVGQELVFNASPLLYTTWGRWSIDARQMLLRAVLADLKTIPGHELAPKAEFAERIVPHEDQVLCDRLCETMGDQTTLLHHLARVDGHLSFDLSAPSVPLRQLVSETLALLRRRNLLDHALTLWSADSAMARSLGFLHLGAGSSLLPATTEHLCRTGWIAVQTSAGNTAIRIAVLSWWLIDGLAQVARGDLSISRWLRYYQLDSSSPSYQRALEASIAGARKEISHGSKPWILGECR